MKPLKAVRRASESGALYKVTKLSYIDGKLVGPGEKNDTVVYDGVPGSALEPMNEAALKAKRAAAQTEAEERELKRAKAEAEMTGEPLKLQKVTAPEVRLWTTDPRNKRAVEEREADEERERKEADEAGKRTAEAMKAGEAARAAEAKAAGKPDVSGAGKKP